MAFSFKQQCAFLLKLGAMLHKYGTPAFRLEAHLKTLAVHLDLDGYFLVSPTTLTYCLWPKDAPDGDVFNYSMRVKPGDLDLGSLARTDALVNELVAGRCTLEEAGDGLKAIEASGSDYPAWVTLAAFLLLGSAFAMLMRGSWHDVAWVGALSMLVYGFIAWADRSPRIATLLEPLAATVVAAVSVGASRWDPGINQPLVVLASLITFVPGLSLAIGFRELAARELNSGTARIMDSLMVLFKLYFGTVLGVAIGVLVWGEVLPTDDRRVPPWTLWPAVLLLAGGLAVAYKARPIDAPWGVISGVLAYGVSTLVTPAWGITLGAFLGAFVVGMYANLFARWRNAPATLVILPGIVVLVPGSKVYVGLDSVISGRQIVSVDDIGVQTFLLFMSLIAGLIFASAVVEPRKSL